MTKVFFIHGIGGQEATINEWSGQWLSKISEVSGIPTTGITPHFFLFDQLFKDRGTPDGDQYRRAFSELIDAWIGGDRPESRGLFDGVRDGIGNTAGMVAQFATDAALRQQLSAKLAAELDQIQPDIVIAHSLGTLVTYNLLRPEAVSGKSRNFTLVTSGAQIGHPAMRGLFSNQIGNLKIPFWVNLYNKKDKVFAWRSIEPISPENFMEVETTFGGLLGKNHEPLEYWSDENAREQAWPMVFDRIGSRKFKKGEIPNLVARNKVISKGVPKKVKNKALLVGINNYPDPSNQLYGCVNDAFRMSEVLQEMGMEPNSIKMVLNENATSDNLRTMMHWLLDNTEEGDNRFFFYSGHGAQIPSAALNGESDHLDECLVTYDFDWTREHSYTDKDFVEAYRQLKYGVNFTVMLDCCHSGGMGRDGMFKAKGMTPPDDVRHRSIKWDPKREMWIPRRMPLSKRKIFSASEKAKQLYTGRDGNTERFGRGVALWTDADVMEKAKKTFGTRGTFMPLILEACAEQELAFEYKHGVTSYGAFTFVLSTLLRQYNREMSKKSRGKSQITFKEVVKKVGAELGKMDFNQNPQVIGPKAKINSPVPDLNVQ